MNRYKLSKAGINTKEGIARFGGNAEAYEQILKEFIYDPYFSRVCENIANGDVQAAFQAAHALKGIVGNLSMIRLYDDICPLVEELRNGKLSGTAELLETATRDYDEVIAALS